MSRSRTIAIGASVSASLLVGLSCAPGARSPARWFVPVSDTGIEFLNVSGRADQLPVLDQNGQGAAVVDADGDGLLDIVLVNGTTADALGASREPGHRLYRNLGNWRFEDVTSLAGLGPPVWATGVAVGDVDADGKDDLLITGWTPTAGSGGSAALYLNRGDGGFEEVTEAWGLETISGYATGATFLDANADGNIDLFIARYVDFDPESFPTTEEDGGPCLYRGLETGCGPWTYAPLTPMLFIQRDRRFEDASKASGIVAPEVVGCRGFQPVTADFDGDADLDIYLGCDVGPNLLFENRSADGSTRFVERGLELGAAVNADGLRESGMGLALLPTPGGTPPSLVVTNFSAEKNTLYLNRGEQFVDASQGSGLDSHRAAMGWSVGVEDFDGDGHDDAVIANGHIYPQVEALGDPLDRLAQPLFLFRGMSEFGRFEEVESGGGLWAVPHENHRALVVADLDEDGRPDLLVTTHRGEPQLFRNVVSYPVYRPARMSANPDSFRNQGYLSARDPRRFLGWAVAD